jgi:hypothetical protein
LGIATRKKSPSSRQTELQASRLAAIRAIVDLADDQENYDAAAAALVILGASPLEIDAATLPTTP